MSWHYLGTGQVTVTAKGGGGGGGAGTSGISSCGVVGVAGGSGGGGSVYIQMIGPDEPHFGRPPAFRKLRRDEWRGYR